MDVTEHGREESGTRVRLSPSQRFASCVAGPEQDLAEFSGPRCETGQVKALGPNHDLCEPRFPRPQHRCVSKKAEWADAVCAMHGVTQTVDNKKDPSTPGSAAIATPERPSGPESPRGLCARLRRLKDKAAEVPSEQSSRARPGSLWFGVGRAAFSLSRILHSLKSL